MRYYGEALLGRTQNHPIRQLPELTRDTLIKQVEHAVLEEEQHNASAAKPLQMLPPRATNYKQEIDYGRIANPTVHRVMNQLRIVINEIIDRYPALEGRPVFDRIHVEMARGLKQTKAEREQTDKANKENAGINKLNYEAAKTVIPHLTEAEFFGGDYAEKMRFYHKLKTAAHSCCLYCGKTISLTDVLSAATQVDHIIPFSRSYDDSNANKLLVHYQCNQNKSNRLPYEMAGGHAIYDRAEKMYIHFAKDRDVAIAKRKSWRFAEDAMEILDNSRKAKLNGMTPAQMRAAGLDPDLEYQSRMLKDTQYISKVTRQYVECLVARPHHVQTLKGKLTHDLRNKWKMMERCGVESGKKSRADHRHHAVDALIIALCELKTVQQISHLSGKIGSRRVTGSDLLQELPGWVNKGKLGDPNLEHSYNKLVVSQKLNHDADGRLFKETAYGEPTPPAADSFDDAEQASAELALMENFDSITSISFDSYVGLCEKNLSTAKPKSPGKLRYIAVDPVLRQRFDDAVLEHMPELKKDQAAAKENKRDNKDSQPIKTLVERVRDELKSATVGNRDVAPIRHLRVYTKQGSATTIKSAPYKKYNTDGYSKVMLWAVPLTAGANDKWGVGYDLVTRFIPILGQQAAHIEPWLRANYDQAKKTGEHFAGKTLQEVEASTSFDMQELMRPHPAAKLVMELRKADTIALPATEANIELLTSYGGVDNSPNPTIIHSHGRDWILARVVLLAKSADKLSIAALNDAGTAAKGPMRYVAGLVTAYQMHRCHVSPSGKVRIMARPKLMGANDSWQVLPKPE